MTNQSSIGTRNAAGVYSERSACITSTREARAAGIIDAATGEQTTRTESMVSDMTNAQTNPRTPRNPLRLWPGVVAAVLLILLRFVLPSVLPDAQFFGLESGVVGLIGWVFGAAAIVVWWVGFSRAPWSERLGALVWMIIAVLGISRLVHESIAGAGMETDSCARRWLRCPQTTPSDPSLRQRLRIRFIADHGVFTARCCCKGQAGGWPVDINLFIAIH